MWIPLDRDSATPLIRQIYLAVRQQILEGRLAAHQKLPASRALASELGVSRNVVLNAFDQLIAEGYLETRLGAGTYVAEGAVWSIQPAPVAAPIAPIADQSLINFRSGIPALDRFPRQRWGQLAKQVSLTVSDQDWGYGTPEGCWALRSTLVDYLRRSRGVVCTPEQIIITSGAAQAFGLVARLLTQPGDPVAIEDPAPPEVRRIFTDCGIRLYPIPVDDRGMQTDWLDRAPPLRFILVTPSHQFPLGSVLTIQRRIELLEFARSHATVIVEDDYDSEFRYEGTPVSSIQGLEPDRVIYIGSFSKILSPALRLGYLVLPPAYVADCRELKRLIDLHSAMFEQQILAALIAAGDLEIHISRMKKLYRQRRNALRQQLHAQFGDRVQLSGDSTGLHLVAHFADLQFTPELLSRCEQAGVRVYPVTQYAIEPAPYRSQVVLGFGNLSISQIETGVQRLKIGIDGKPDA